MGNDIFWKAPVKSVGYRVNSRNATSFRKWATTTLKEYLSKGFVVRNNLLQERYDELKSLVDTMGRAMQYLETGADDQIKSIFDVVSDYTYALDTLDGYEKDQSFKSSIGQIYQTCDGQELYPSVEEKAALESYE